MKNLMSIVCLILLTSSVHGQETSLPPAEASKKSAFEDMVFLRIRTMQVACSEAVKHSSKLELVADQRVEIEQLHKEYKQKIASLIEEKNVESASNDKKVAGLIDSLDDLERRLANKILQPDQSKQLHSLVFARLLKANSGDLATTLTTFYPKRFKFDDSQKTKMKEISKTAGKKIETAKQTLEDELEKELEEIADETETEVRDLLTQKQSELLEELQGQ